MRGNREGKAHIHSRGIMLYRRIEKTLNLSEGNDLVEFLANLGTAHAEDRPIKKDVLAAGQLRVKPGTDLEQTRDPTAECDPPGGRFGDAREDFEQCRLAGAVPTDDAENLSLIDVEV